jgi:hypothetical protein
MKSRWTLALRFAAVQKIKPSKLISFLNEKGKGGLAGRARDYAKKNTADKKNVRALKKSRRVAH